MKHKLHLLPIAAMLLCLLSACESSTTTVNNPIIVAPSPSLFVVNEGNFGDKNSTLDAVLFRTDSGKKDTTIDHNILPTGMGEGNDILIVGNHVLVLDYGSNTLNIIDADSLRLLSTISFGLNGPNKMALIGPNMLLVTLRSSTIAAIVDLTKNAIVDSGTIGEPVVAVAVLNNKAYITSGTYNPPGHLNILDLATNKIIQRIWLRNTPEQCVADSANNQVIIGTAGDYDTVPPAIYFVNSASDSFVDSLVVGSPSSDGEVTIGSRHFLIIAGDVYPLSGPTHTLPNPLISSKTTFYKGFYDAVANDLYLGEYNFNVAAGKVDVFDGMTGAAKWSFASGIGPAHFAFYR
jgi:hypothetical protein